MTAIAPIAWGATYVVTRQLLPAETPLWGSVIRCLPAGLLVLLIVRRLPQGAWWWRSLVLGVLNVGGFCVLVYIVGQRLPSTLAAALMSASAAGMMLFAWMLLRQRPTLRAALGALIGIGGVVLMLGIGGEDVDGWGVVASVGAMLASSLGFVLTARWGQGVPPLTMTAWQLLAGSLVLLPVALLVEGPPPVLDAAAAAGFAFVIVVGTALAYAAWFTGLRRLRPGVVGIVGLLNPVTGAVLGVAVGGEAFGLPQFGGLALVVCGVLLGVVPGRMAVRRRRSAVFDAPASVSRDGMRG